MADDDNESSETDLDEESAAPEGGGMMKKLIMAVVALALIGGGAFAGMTFFGKDEPLEGEIEELAEEPEVASGPPLYTSLHPPLVVNFKDALGDAHFMQITMEVMSREQTVLNSVREHTPVIRNALILLYSSSVYEEVTTRAGKEKMLADGLSEIQQILVAQTGEVGVEALYFTALVIQ
jgi:flagellar FliL protein